MHSCMHGTTHRAVLQLVSQLVQPLPKYLAVLLGAMQAEDAEARLRHCARGSSAPLPLVVSGSDVILHTTKPYQPMPLISVGPAISLPKCRDVLGVVNV